MKYCDLHCHTAFSDGTGTPEELVDLACSAGLSAIAVTDHNTLGGIERGAAAAKGRIEFCGGCEFTTEAEGHELHLLGLFLDPFSSDSLNAALEGQLRRKEASNRATLDRLAADYDVSFDEFTALFGGGVKNRVHIANYLVKKGICANKDEAFDSLLASGSKYYIESQKLDFYTMIPMIKEAGGVTVWAHPLYKLDHETCESIIIKAKEAGLDGIEAYYSEFSDEETEFLLEMSKKYDLLTSGGSDYHGESKTNLSVGTGHGGLRVPFECYENLKLLADERKKQGKIKMKIVSEKVKDKIAASLLCGALGDALGYAIEFKKWASIQAEYGDEGISELELKHGSAIISDDTQMTLFTAEGMCLSYSAARESSTAMKIEEAIYLSYMNWYKTQGGKADRMWNNSALMNVPELNYPRAPGNTCLYALGSGIMGTVEKPINNSKGCGGVMRTAPLGFIRNAGTGLSPFGPAFECGAKAAAITHGHPMGWIPAGMLSDIVDRCIYGEYDSLEQIILASFNEVKEKYAGYEGMAEFENMILRAVSLAKKNKAENRRGIALFDEPAIRSIGEGWVGDEALAIAVYAALRYDGDVKACLKAAVNHSGDSDSTGAIAGNILGAYLGLEKVPADWAADVELADVMTGLAETMANIVDGK